MTNEENYIDNELISLSIFLESLNISHTAVDECTRVGIPFFNMTGARKRRQEL